MHELLFFWRRWVSVVHLGKATDAEFIFVRAMKFDPNEPSLNIILTGSEACPKREVGHDRSFFHRPSVTCANTLGYLYHLNINIHTLVYMYMRRCVHIYIYIYTYTYMYVFSQVFLSTVCQGNRFCKHSLMNTSAETPYPNTNLRLQSRHAALRGQCIITRH